MTFRSFDVRTVVVIPHESSAAATAEANHKLTAFHEIKESSNSKCFLCRGASFVINVMDQMEVNQASHVSPLRPPTFLALSPAFLVLCDFGMRSESLYSNCENDIRGIYFGRRKTLRLKPVFKEF